jgi:hypothetical protein
MGLVKKVRFIVICERMGCSNGRRVQLHCEQRAWVRAAVAPRLSWRAPHGRGERRVKWGGCRVIFWMHRVPAHSNAAYCRVTRRYRRVQRGGRGEVTMHFAACRRRLPRPRRSTAASKISFMATISRCVPPFTPVPFAIPHYSFVCAPPPVIVW